MSLASVKTFLADSTAIATLVADRLYALRAPQSSVFPYIVLDQISDSPEYVLTGESGQSRLTAQIDCYTREPNGFFTVKRLADAVRNRLSGYGGLLDETVWASKATMIRNNILTEPATDGSDIPIRRVSMDFEFVYGHAVPDFT